MILLELGIPIVTLKDNLQFLQLFIYRIVEIDYANNKAEIN